MQRIQPVMHPIVGSEIHEYAKRIDCSACMRNSRILHWPLGGKQDGGQCIGIQSQEV